MKATEKMLKRFREECLKSIPGYFWIQHAPDCEICGNLIGPDQEYHEDPARMNVTITFRAPLHPDCGCTCHR